MIQENHNGPTILEKRFIFFFCWKFSLNGGGWLWLDWISLSRGRFGVNKIFNILSLCLQSFEALNFYKFLDTFPEQREGLKLDFKIFSLILKIKMFFNGKIIFFSSSQILFLLI